MMLALCKLKHPKSCDTSRQLPKPPECNGAINSAADIKHWYQNHIIRLNNHFNMMNAVVSLMAPSASRNTKHVIAMYVPKTNMPLKCHIHQLAHVHT